MTKKIDNFNFEDAMQRLDKITEELSRDGVELEAALALYEEGVKLARLCNAKLEETEQKIKILQVSPDGELVQKDFQSGDDPKSEI